MKEFNKEELVVNTAKFMKTMDMDLNDPNFTDTPERVSRMWNEICLPQEVRDEQCEKILSKTFPSTYSGMVVSHDIRAYSICGHHLLPIVLDVYIGYIPNDMVLGLSKLARLAEVLAKQPMIQENYTDEIAKKLMTVLKPKGVGVYVKGVHYCQTMRGAKQRSATMTTLTVDGCFMDELKTREEFLKVIGV